MPTYTYFNQKGKNNYMLIIPKCVTKFNMKITAGGGAGGIGDLKDGIFYSGGGGGAGETLNRNINKPKGKEWVLLIIVGRGGKSPSEDGEYSAVILDKQGVLFSSKPGKGGGSGINNYGGLSGNRSLTSNGLPGSFTYPSQSSPKGGKGGKSKYKLGGRGGYTHGNEKNEGEDGQCGSGGGGSTVGTPKSGKGGCGYITINY